MKYDLIRSLVKYVERACALVLLITMLPALIFLGCLLRANTDEQVVVADQLSQRDGKKLRLHRFRTTGRGTDFFRWLGRHLRLMGIDEIPAVWDVVLGRIRFRNLVQLNRNL